MSKLKLLKEAQTVSKVGSKINLLKDIQQVVDPAKPLNEIKEMFDQQVTKKDYNSWLKTILMLCKQRNLRPTTRQNFVDCAFEVLDNDPKIDLFLDDDVEQLKRRIVNTLWNAYRASEEHAKLKQHLEKTKNYKHYEEEQSENLNHYNSDSDNCTDDKFKFSETDIDVMTQRYPEQQLGDWDVPRRSEELEQQSEFAQLYRQHVGLEDEQFDKTIEYALRADPKQKTDDTRLGGVPWVQQVAKHAYNTANDDVKNNRKTNNPYPKGTIRFKLWDAAYKKGVDVLTNKQLSTKEEEEEISTAMITRIQDQGYQAAKKYYKQAVGALRTKSLSKVPTPINPYPKQSLEAKMWEDGFDVFMKDIEVEKIVDV